MSKENSVCRYDTRKDQINGTQGVEQKEVAFLLSRKPFHCSVQTYPHLKFL